MRKIALIAAALVAGILVSAQGLAEEKDGHWLYAQIGAYEHYSDDEDFRGTPVMVSFEVHNARNRFYGLSLFDNSFGQFSQFVYYGWEFPLPRLHRYARAKLALGIVHGYRGEFEDELALNFGRFAPGLVPAIGFKKDGLGVDLLVLSNAALMLSVGKDFDL
ncbi:MAG: hypothetical protein AAGA23_00915 [Pseudomonadota bacterium]